MDSHSSSSNYHDSWETRSSYPERDRYPERDTRDQARDASFERRHGERDRRDNRERGWSDSHVPFSTQQLGDCSSNVFQVTANIYDLDSVLGSIVEAIHIIFVWCKRDYVNSYQCLINWTLALLVLLCQRSQVGTTGKLSYWVRCRCLSGYFIMVILVIITKLEIPLNVGLLEKKCCDVVDSFKVIMNFNKMRKE